MTNEIERLSWDYIRGYTAAIMMMREQFNHACNDLKRFRKRPTEKLTNELLSLCLRERGTLREYHDSFVRWNNKENKFEVWREKWNVGLEAENEN